jgi:hypothetical protein
MQAYGFKEGGKLATKKRGDSGVRRPVSRIFSDFPTTRPNNVASNRAFETVPSAMGGGAALVWLD